MENRINLGELDTLVTIKSCTITTGSQGEKKFSFSTYGDVYAKLDRNVSEIVANTNLEEGKYVLLTIYKIRQLDTTWQVVVNGLSYEITGIDPVSRISPVCTLTLHALD